VAEPSGEATVEAVTLDEADARYLASGTGLAPLVGPVLVGGLFFAIGSLLAPPVSFVVSGVGLAVGFAVANVVLRRRLDARRRRGLRVVGPLSVVRTELDPVGSLPARVVWGLQAPGLGRGVEVPHDAAVVLDPEGVERIARRRADGAWPGGAAARATLPGRGAVLVSRRSRVLLAVELEGGPSWHHPPVRDDLVEPT